ncbi:MAG: hypothetical protein JWL70_159 [Acidimicrobiia bacterium]|nr:hypothetical protein [Acidimicrobiia bacterium]
MSLLGKPRRKPLWADLGPRFIAAVPTAQCSSGDSDSTWVAWHEGPSIATVQAAVGEVPGWEWRAVAPAADPALPPPSTGSVIWVRRSFDHTTLASAIVRYQAAYNRAFNSGDERGRQRLADLLDHDLPSPQRDPIVELVAQWLLEFDDPQPPVEPPATELDGLAEKLRHLGYDRLWAEAYKQVS